MMPSMEPSFPAATCLLVPVALAFAGFVLRRDNWGSKSPFGLPSTVSWARP